MYPVIGIVRAILCTGKLARSMVVGATVVALALSMFSTRALAAPVEYVRVCQLDGPGFWYVPGSDVCVKLEGRGHYDVQPVPFGAMRPASDWREAACRQFMPGFDWNPGSTQCLKLDFSGPNSATGTLRSYARLGQSAGELAGYNGLYAPAAGKLGGWEIGVGANIASAWTRSTYEDNPAFSGSGWGFGPSLVIRKYVQPNMFIGGDFGWMSTDIRGNDGGVFADYRWQGWAGLQGGIVVPAGSVPLTVYGGGGLAVGGVSAGFRGQTVQETMSGTLPGWTFNIGAEAPVAQNFKLGIDYRRSEFSGDLAGSQIKAAVDTFSFTGRYYVGDQYPSLVRSSGGLYSTTWNDGLYLGLYGVQTRGELGLREFSESLERITFHSCDWFDPFGIGIMAGYALNPWGNIRVSPFVSVDYPNQTLNHVFPGGNFIGTRSNVVGSAGVKAGPVIDMGASLPSFWLYGSIAASVLNEDLRISLGGPFSSANQNVGGATFGGGLSFQPSFLQGMGRPVALFVEYDFTRWASAHLNSPTASPFFDYTFHREDEVIKFGFNIALETPSAPSSMPVKAPRLSK